MDKILNFIKKNIAVIFIIILIIRYICLSLCKQNTEYMVDIESEEIEELDPLDNMVNKLVYLKYTQEIDDKLETTYLARVLKGACQNKIKKSSRECIKNLVVLQDDLKKNCVFKLKRIPNTSPHKYMLTHGDTDNIVSLDQHLFTFKTNAKRPLCMDFYSPLTDPTKNRFELEKTENGTYKLQFKKGFDKKEGTGVNEIITTSYYNFYVGLCTSMNKICEYDNKKNKRVCMMDKIKDAIDFEIVAINENDIDNLPNDPKIIEQEQEEGGGGGDERQIEPFYVTKSGHTKLVTAMGNLLNL